MAEKDEIQKRIKEEIARLDKASAKAYQDKLKGLDAINASLDTYQSLLNNIKNDVADMNKGFSGILGEIKAIVGELEKGNKSTKDATKAFKGLESIASKLKYDQQGYNDLNIDQLKTEKSKLSILENQARAAAKQLAQDKGIVDLAHTNLSFRRDLSEEERAILEAAKEGFTVYERTNKLLKERIKEEKEINKKLGVTGALLMGMSKIPIVGPLLKTNEALDIAREKAKAGGNAFQVMGAGLASVGKSLLSSLTDPLVVIGLMVKAFQELLKLGFKLDKQTTSLQKTLYLSRTEAEMMHKSFGAMNRTQTQLVDGYEAALSTLQNQTDAANQLGVSFGAVSRVTNEEIQNQIKLTKQLGLSVEESQALYVLARQNNMTQDDITKEVVSQVNTFKKQSGTLLDSKKILQDVSKISGQLRLQYGNNVKQLVAATVQANKLGFSLEKTKQIAEGLLNFEESIENELSAELLIGRDLNLEQARLLALNGKSAEATALIAENMGGSAGFAAMNVIQQESLAKALNMSADELANSIMHQENLKRLSVEDKKRLEEKLAYYKSIGEIEKAQQLERAAANEGNISAALEAVDAETKFQAAVESIKDSLASLVEGPAMKLANGLAEMLVNGTGLARVITNIGLTLAALSMASFLRQLVLAGVAAGTLAAGTATTVSALTLGAGAVAVIAGLMGIMSAFNSASEAAERKATKTNYASGGIVGGNSLVGDNVKINANSGEMVLNRRQQAKLFSLINNGGGGGDTQLNANLILDGQVLANAITKIEKTYSNKLGSARQEANRLLQ